MDKVKYLAIAYKSQPQIAAEFARVWIAPTQQYLRIVANSAQTLLNEFRTLPVFIRGTIYYIMTLSEKQTPAIPA